MLWAVTNPFQQYIAFSDASVFFSRDVKPIPPSSSKFIHLDSCLRHAGHTASDRIDELLLL